MSLLFNMLLWEAYNWRGSIFTGEGGVWGSTSLFFIPALFSWGEKGFLSQFSLYQKCHGLVSWWVLLIYKVNLFCYENTMSGSLYMDARDSHFSPFSFFLSVTGVDTYHPKYVVSCQSEGSYFPLSAYGPLLFIRCTFPITCPLPPFLCSYLDLAAAAVTHLL